MSIFHLPDLGEGLQDAEIVAWHVSVGDHVVADQPLVSVETEKAVVEIPAPQAGTVTALHGAPGDVVAVGAPLVEFGGDATDAGAIVGDLPASATVPATPASMPAPSTGGVRAVPAARALARERGIDLEALVGSGPGGAVTLADVVSAGGTVPAGAPLRGARRAMAANMARAGAAVVPATVSDSADVDTWWAPDADVTVRLIRAVAAGCAAEPALNQGFDGTALTRHAQVDLGLAVDTADGLLVPVLRDIGGRDAAALRTEASRLVQAVHDRSIAAADLRGATISLSNFGMIGGRYAALVVVPPQVAILGAGRVVAEARLVGGALVPHRCLPLSLTFDHRAVTGGEAARFLAAVIGDLEMGSGAASTGSSP